MTEKASKAWTFQWKCQWLLAYGYWLMDISMVMAKKFDDIDPSWILTKAAHSRRPFPRSFAKQPNVSRSSSGQNGKVALHLVNIHLKLILSTMMKQVK